MHIKLHSSPQQWCPGARWSVCLGWVWTAGRGTGQWDPETGCWFWEAGCSYWPERSHGSETQNISASYPNKQYSMINTYKQHIMNANENPAQQQHIIVLRERIKPPTMYVVTSPSLLTFFHSSIFVCLKMFTYGCCHRADGEIQTQSSFITAGCLFGYSPPCMCAVHC